MGKMNKSQDPSLYKYRKTPSKKKKRPIHSLKLFRNGQVDYIKREKIQYIKTVAKKKKKSIFPSIYLSNRNTTS